MAVIGVSGASSRHCGIASRASPAATVPPVLRLDPLPGARARERRFFRLPRQDRLEAALVKLGRDGGALLRARALDPAVVPHPLHGELAVAAGFPPILDPLGA